jgi:hypothetical protein
MRVKFLVAKPRKAVDRHEHSSTCQVQSLHFSPVSGKGAVESLVEALVLALVIVVEGQKREPFSIVVRDKSVAASALTRSNSERAKLDTKAMSDASAGTVRYLSMPLATEPSSTLMFWSQSRRSSLAPSSSAAIAPTSTVLLVLARATALLCYGRRSASPGARCAR